MNLEGCKLEPVETVLYGFTGHTVYPKEEIVLPLTVGAGDLRNASMTTFMVVNALSSYNIILGRLSSFSHDWSSEVDVSSCTMFIFVPLASKAQSFALFMAIDHVGSFTASWAGGLLLYSLNVTRTTFDNLWVAILVRSVLPVLPIIILFLIPSGDPNAAILAAEI